MILCRWLFYFCSLTPLAGEAKGLFRLETETLYSMKTGAGQKTEHPFYQFFQSDYQSAQQQFSFTTSFGYHTNFDGSRGDFNLYIFNFDYDVIPKKVRVFAGRNFHPYSTMSASLSDRLGSEIFFLNGRLVFGAYYGEEFRTLIGNSATKASEQTGVYVQYKTSSSHPATLSLKQEYNDYEEHDRGTQNLVDASIHKSWSGVWGVETYANSEYNTTRSKVQSTQVGMDLYPTSSWVLSFIGQSFHQDEKDEWEVPIYSIFAEGTLYEYGIRAGYQWSSRFFSSLSASYTDYLQPAGNPVYGYKTELGLSYNHRIFQIDNTTYFLDSIGGSVVGNRAEFYAKIFSSYEAQFGFETTYYKKITQSERHAWSSFFGLGTWLWDQFKLSLSGEALANNDSQSDFRFIAQLNYAMWKDIQ